MANCNYTDIDTRKENKCAGGTYKEQNGPGKSAKLKEGGPKYPKMSPIQRDRSNGVKRAKVNASDWGL
jgi:hypothetical protein